VHLTGMLRQTHHLSLTRRSSQPFDVADEHRPGSLAEVQTPTITITRGPDRHIAVRLRREFHARLPGGNRSAHGTLEPRTTRFIHLNQAGSPCPVLCPVHDCPLTPLALTSSAPCEVSSAGRRTAPPIEYVNNRNALEHQLPREPIRPDDYSIKPSTRAPDQTIALTLATTEGETVFH
jgi:hypothetical protein